MMKAVSLDLTISQRRILDFVRKQNPVTRADLVPMTGLSPGAISRLVRDLIDMNLLRELDRISGMRGQPALPLQVSGAGGISIGIALPYGRLDVVALDYSGRQLAIETAPFEAADRDKLRDKLERQIGAVLSSDRVESRRLVGIGFAIPGHLPADGGNDFIIPPTLDWLDVEALTRWLSKRYQSPLYIENIANSAAVAEVYAAEDSAPRNMAAINFGHGVGAGLVLSGRIHRGAGGLAGEIGGLFPMSQPRPSAHDLLVAMRSTGRSLPSIDGLASALEADDRLANAWIVRAAQQLFPLARMLRMIIAPECIVLTGMLPTSITAPLAQNLSEQMAMDAQGAPLYPTKIMPARLGTYSNVVGAAWLPIESEGLGGKNRAQWGVT